MNEMFGDIFNWKLNNFMDYFRVFVILFGSFLLLYLYTKYARKIRTDSAAIIRVGKRLKSAAGRNGRVFNNITLMLEGEEHCFDHLVVDQTGVLLIKTYGRGLAVHGQHDSEKWKVSDAEQSITIDNPILKLNKSVLPLQNLLGANDIYKVSIDCIAVFADSFDKPNMYLGRKNVAVPFHELKAFMKNRKAVLSSCPTQSIIPVIESAINK